MQKNYLKLLFFILISSAFLLKALPGSCSQLKVVSILDVLTYEATPFSFEDSRQTAGIATEIVEKLFTKTKTKYYITEYPFKEAYERAKTKESSLIYPLARTSQNEFDFKWIGPIANNSIYIFQLQGGKAIKIMALSNLKNFKTGVVKNSAAHKFLISQNLTKNLNIETTNEANISKLYNKQINLIAGNELEILYQAKKLGLNHKNIKKIYKLIDNQGYYLGFNKLISKDLLTEIRKAFFKMESSGEIRVLVDNFLNK